MGEGADLELEPLVDGEGRPGQGPVQQGSYLQASGKGRRRKSGRQRADLVNEGNGAIDDEEDGGEGARVLPVHERADVEAILGVAREG